MRKIRLFQKDAYIGIDFMEKKTEIIKMKGDHDQDAFSFDIDVADGKKKTIAIANPKILETNAIKEELSAFINSIENGKPVIVSEIDGYLAMEVAHKILEKIGNNNAIALQ
jgi:hypothetical protein